MSKKRYVLYAVLFALKFGFYGFTYYPVLDDYIQYHVFSLYDNPWQDVIVRLGSFRVRPLAALADVYVWTHLWNCTWVALLTITLFHFLFVLLSERLLHRLGIPVGSVFWLILGCYPLLTEATYWLSASSRIVVASLLSVIAAWLLLLFLDKGKWYKLALCIPLLLASLCFYEQVAAMSLALTGIVLWKRRAAPILWALPLGCLTAIGIYYLAFSTGNGRGTLALTLWGNAREIAYQVGLCMGKFNWYLLRNGLFRGIALLWERPWYLAAVIIASACLFFVRSAKNPSPRAAILPAILLVVAPFAPFLILRQVHISFRNLFPSFLGIAILADLALHRIRLQSLIAPIAAALFLTVNISELHDYRAVYQSDNQIVKQIAPHADSTRTVYVVGAEACYVEQNSYYHEHIHNLTQSDWALTGGVRSFTKNPAIRHIMPVSADFTDFEENAIILKISQQKTE